MVSKYYIHIYSKKIVHTYLHGKQILHTYLHSKKIVHTYLHRINNVGINLDAKHFVTHFQFIPGIKLW